MLGFSTISLSSYKGEGELDVSPEQALHYVTPGNDLPRKQWDSTTKVSLARRTVVRKLPLT